MHVIEARKSHVSWERREWHANGWLVCCSQSSHRPPVEATLEGDDIGLQVHGYVIVVGLRPAATHASLRVARGWWSPLTAEGCVRRWLVLPAHLAHGMMQVVLLGQLEGALVGLCAAVGKEHLAEVLGVLHHELCQLQWLLGVEDVTDVLDLESLRCNDSSKLLVAVAQRVHSDSTKEV